MTHGTSSRRPLFDVDAALANPSAYFAEPGEILAHPALALDVQRKLLHQWEQDARQLAEAETEGMEGGEPNMLRRVREALATLEERGEAAMRDAPSTIRNAARTVTGGVQNAASRVREGAAHTRDGVGEVRAVIRAQPITAGLLIFAFGYIVGRLGTLVPGGHRR
jgi:hypothetical protein